MLLRKLFGENFADIEIEVVLRDGRIRLFGSDFALCYIGRQGKSDVFQGEYAEVKLTIFVEQTGDETIFDALLESGKALDCQSIAFRLLYREEGVDFSDRRVICAGKNVANSGLHRIGEHGGTKEDSRYCGLFQGSQKPCVFFATKFPQKNLHLYQTKLNACDEVLFTATTYFPEGQRKKTSLRTEQTILMQNSTPLQSLQKFASYYPPLPEDRFPKPLCGWNSWDYYFSALESADILENADAIANHPKLKEALSCLVIDMGWEHREGEWYANYRFPEGMEAITKEIRARGLVPGVWTNGAQIRVLSYPALRQGEMLLKDENGTPIQVDGMYVVDPTHPEGEAYLHETYSRLYGYGFRIFKVDFVDAILQGDRFYDQDAGPYDAIRKVMSIVRQAIGEDAHIIGCSYPPECGAGYVDSSRIGVDIHNQWGHARWVMEYLQHSFWENGKLFRIDPDFLLVRGKDTSLEEETNVFNPFEFLPYEEGSVTNRWRRGEVFDRYEAETWANVSVFSGGNLFFADRFSMLNEAGWAMVESHLEPEETAAIPLDFGEGSIASFWYIPKGDGGKLLMINQNEEDTVLEFPFAEYGLQAPAAVSADKEVRYEGAVVKATLRRHESTVICWN